MIERSQKTKQLTVVSTPCQEIIVSLCNTIFERFFMNNFYIHQNLLKIVGSSKFRNAGRLKPYFQSGQIFIVIDQDLNLRQVHFFKAHDHPIKCMALGPEEDIVVTGCVDGDIKVLDL